MSEARGWIEQLLPTAGALDPQPRAELLWTAAVTAVEVGDDPAALADRHRLAPLLDKIGDAFLRALCQMALAWTSTIAGDLRHRAGGTGGRGRPRACASGPGCARGRYYGRGRPRW